MIFLCINIFLVQKVLWLTLSVVFPKDRSLLYLRGIYYCTVNLQ